MKPVSSPRLLIDLERRRYPYSGLGYYCRALEMGLREVGDSGLEYHFYAPRGAGGEGRVAFSPLHAFFNPSPRGFDLIHLTHQRQHYFPQLWGKPCLVTLHDLNFLTEPLAPKKREKLLRLVASNLRRAKGIACISHYVKEDLMRHRELFELAEDLPVRVIHNGIFLPDEARLASLPKPRLIPRAPYLLALGVLHEKKQQHLLIPMLAALPEELQLVLVYSEAKADYLERITSLVARYGLQGRVHLMKAVGDEEKAQLLYHCRALVHPSMAEGFGLPVVEAMSLGKPLFLRPMTSLPEVGGAEAYYFRDVEPEAMASLVLEGLELHEREAERGQRLRERALLFDYRAMARGYQDLYTTLLERR